MYEEAKEIWQQTYRESVEYRIMHTINSINLSLKIDKEIALDQEQGAKDRLDAAERLVDTEMNFLKLLREVHDDDTRNEPEPQIENKPNYPYVVKDGKYFADPKWIEENKKKVMRESNLH